MNVFEMSKAAASAMLVAVLAMGMLPGAAFGAGAQLQAGTAAVSAQSVKPKTPKAAPKSLYSLYKPAIKKAAGATGPFKEYNSVLHSSYEAVYALYDMNSDGVPELVFHAGVYAGAGQNCYVYTVKGGKLKYCGKTNAGFGGVHGGKKRCYISQAHTGCVSYWSLELKDFKLVRKSAFSGTDVGGGWQAFAKKAGITDLSWSTCTDYSLLKKRAKITSKRIYDASVSVQKSATYTGKALKPKVTVKYLGKALEAGKDYSVSYRNAKGKKVSAPKAIGAYKVTVRGKGSYKGSQTATFTVKKRAPVTVKATGVRVTLPEYWRGKVKAKIYSNGAWGKDVSICDKKSGEAIATVQCAKKSSFRSLACPDRPLIAGKNGSAYRAELSWSPWVIDMYKLGDASAKAKAARQVKLLTGGNSSGPDDDRWYAKAQAYLKKAVLKKMRVY